MEVNQQYSQVLLMEQKMKNIVYSVEITGLVNLQQGADHQIGVVVRRICPSKRILMGVSKCTVYE